MTTENENENEDFLEVDNRIPGQNYTCISFISPEKFVQDKNIFYTRNFLNYILGEKQEDDSEEQLRTQFLSNLKDDNSYNNINKLYDDWLYTRRNTLNELYNESVDFTTSVRGVKVRGTYDTLKEAQSRAKVLQRKDPNFNVYVGQIGYWLPWDPDPDTIKDQEYQEGQLNNLMKKYNENIDNRDQHFEERKKDKIAKAKKDNREKNNPTQSEFELNQDDSKGKIAEIRNIHNEKLDIINDPENAKSKSEFEDSLNEKIISLNEDDPWIQRKQKEQPQ
jgi:hypothetical protein